GVACRRGELAVDDEDRRGVARADRAWRPSVVAAPPAGPGPGPAPAVGPPGSLRRGVRDHARGRRTRRPGAAAAGADPGAVPGPGPRAAAAPRPPHIGSRAPRAEPRALRDPWPEPFG